MDQDLRKIVERQGRRLDEIWTVLRVMATLETRMSNALDDLKAAMAADDAADAEALALLQQLVQKVTSLTEQLAKALEERVPVEEVTGIANSLRAEAASFQSALDAIKASMAPAEPPPAEEPPVDPPPAEEPPAEPPVEETPPTEETPTP